MLAGYPPFYDDNPIGIYQKIMDGYYEFPPHIEPKARDLIRSFLCADRSLRMGCSPVSQINSLKYYTKFDLKGNSNYAFPIILKTLNIKKRDLFEKVLRKYNIEFRRGNAGGGNQLRQPYLKKYISNVNLKKFKTVEHVHSFGYYIGNYPSVNRIKITKICKILNSINF